MSNVLRVPCPVCAEPVEITPEDISVQVTPPERGKNLKRVAITVTAVGMANHVHGRSNGS